MVTTIITQYIQFIFSLYTIIGNDVYYFYLNYSRLILDFIHAIFKNLFDITLVVTIILALIYLFMSLYVFVDKHRKHYTLTTGSEPKVTIQIPTFNELAALNCAERCIDFEYPKEKMQIIIGDDSDKIEISRKIDAFATRYNRQYPRLITITRRGGNAGFKPGNLNYMLKYTRGEYIVIFDSDFLPEPHFLRNIIAPFITDKQISAVQARWRPINFEQNVKSALASSVSAVCHHIVLPFINRFKGTSVLCGSAEAIRKKDLEHLGGWLSGSLTEDIEYSLRLIQKNKKLVYLEDLECDCEVPHTFKDLFRQQLRWAFGVIAALKMHASKILINKNVKLKDKASVTLFASGYLFSMLLFIIFALGILSFISDRPAPINWVKFGTETIRNLLLTSGFLLSVIIALMLSKKSHKIPQIIISSLSIGLVLIYYVNIGIYKALFNRKMQWFMLKKNGNKWPQK